MELVYNKLVLTKEAGSTRTSRIMVDMPTPHPLLNVINSGSIDRSTTLLKVDKNKTNSVPLFHPQSIAMKSVLENIICD